MESKTIYHEYYLPGVSLNEWSERKKNEEDYYPLFKYVLKTLNKKDSLGQLLSSFTPTVHGGDHTGKYLQHEITSIFKSLSNDDYIFYDWKMYS